MIPPELPSDRGMVKITCLVHLSWSPFRNGRVIFKKSGERLVWETSQQPPQLRF